MKLSNMSCGKILGSMSVDNREKVTCIFLIMRSNCSQIIRAFNVDHTQKVLLISLKAGGVALNLTVANYIYIMDPYVFECALTCLKVFRRWWNPAAEMQAIDRTHRLGQHKPILATRFIIANSIEERILLLQEKKRLVFEGTVGGDAAAITKLTVDDMKFLFQ